jgi:hypothetical protein
MSFVRNHLPVLLLLLAVVFAAFGRMATIPLWNETDAHILCDAHELSKDPVSMFGHIGFYFSQPLLQLLFLGLYRVFGLEPGGYMAVLLAIHAVNAFLVYMLVNMLFPKPRLAIVAALLFALGVGSYGRVFTSIHQMEGLVLAGLHLLVLYAFVRNDFRHGGRILAPTYLLGLGLFMLTGLTKATLFSLVGTLVAYKLFFHGLDRRRVLSADVMILLGVAALFYWAQGHWGYRAPTVFADDHGLQGFSLVSVKNLFRYLNMLFFPMQSSPLLEEAPPWVVWVYEARTVIRTALALAIIAYSFFGFVFGSRAIRFFIAFTYITVAPFTQDAGTGQWLNLSHLYLTSVGFCVVLSAGTTGTARLLRARPRRMWVPYLVPLVFVVMALGLTDRLYDRGIENAAEPEAIALRLSASATCSR